MALHVEIRIPVLSDSGNTHPPNLTVQSSNGVVTLSLHDRTIVVECDDFIQAAELVKSAR